MIKRLFLFVLFSLFFPHTLSAADYTLNDLFRMALEKSVTIKIAEEDLSISRDGKQKAQSSLLPTLSTFGSYTRYSEVQRGTGFVLQPESTTGWGVRLDQTLSFSGKEFTEYEAARLGIEKSGFDVAAVKEDYLLKVAEVFYDILKFRKAIDIARANEQRLEKHRNAAKTRVEIGEEARTALLRAEAELAGAQADVLRAENAFRLGKIILARRLGIKGEYTLLHEETGTGSFSHEDALHIVIPDCRGDEITCLKEKAFAERADVRALKIQNKISEEEVSAARGGHWPDLSVEGVFSRQENTPSRSFELKEQVYGALKINYPFFEGGLRRAEVSEARARLRQAEFRLIELKQTVSVEVSDAYLSVLTIAGVLEKLQAEVRFAEDNFNTVAQQFFHGLADSVDVIDANTLLVTAERELSNAGYDYERALLTLKDAVGILLTSVQAQ